ncbi:MAG: homoserine dehydrogenase [Anaerolineaceae bacterium]|nr:homoserine dehydrogenase [Anaerolineaceae bacterium]
MRQVNVAIVGLGTVGSGVARILLQSADELAARAGLRLNLKYVCDTDLARPRDVEVPPELLTDSLDRVLQDPQVEVVCELVGGTTVARDIVERILRAGKDVVTANKALLAERGMGLLKLARRQKRSIAFEAAVAGGIPLVLAIRDGLVANRITAVTGIVNGTCNYILTGMTEQGLSYQTALAEAQQKGYAEADPTLDVSGGDSAHKLTILSWLAFGAASRFEDVYCEGIEGIDPADINYGMELGYRIKLLAIGRRDDSGGVSLRVHPTLVPKKNPLAHVGGAFNAIMIRGDAVGDTLHYGLGAGQMPTASAVVADLVDTALGRTAITFSQRQLFDETCEHPVRGIEQVTTRYYLRFEVLDRPGVMAAITGALGRHNISIASCLQHEPIDATHVPLVIMTHQALEGDVRGALAEISALETVRNQPVLIRVVDQERAR